MEKQKILILDKADKVLSDMLSEAGFEACIHTDYAREDVLQQIDQYEGVVIRSKMVFDKQIIDKATN